MKESNLLASAALFKVLYDSKKDIYDVISEFIRTSIIMNSKRAFNSLECMQYLFDDFGFKLPEAVVNSCLKNRLKKEGELSLSHGMYTVTDKLNRNVNIQNEFKDSQSSYEEITRQLVNHVKQESALGIDEEKLKSYFNDYLLGSVKENEYAGLIAKFLITYKLSPGFKEKLSQIEEGLVLYAGIQYTPDLSSLGNWRNNLVIFLDTEHLLSATGLNGDLYKQVFDDFWSLVDEVNQKKGKGRISLRYFDETNDEIYNFFYAAEKIVEQNRWANPSKTAMLKIVNGCKTPSEILQKKAKFLDDLKKLKINIEEPLDYYEHPEFNVESARDTIKLNAQFNYSDENDDVTYGAILKKFTKINVIRKGESNGGVDGISAIFMTENRLIQRIAFSDIVHPGNGAIPFATNIAFLTERLWFKLNKGFGGDIKKPASFDVIIRAKLVLASQINHAVSDTYKDLKEKYKKKEISDEQIATLLSDLKNKPSSPDDINDDTLIDSVALLNGCFIEESLREKSLLEKQAADGKLANEELKRIRHGLRIEKLQPIKNVARRRYRFSQIFSYFIVPATLLFIILSTYTDQDSTLSVIFGVIGLVSTSASVVKYRAINAFLWRRSRRSYKKSLNRVAEGL